MSIKSLLQIILFLLIIIIVGGIYFIYFYTGPLQNKEVLKKEFNLDTSNDKSEISENQEILDGINTDKKKNLNSNYIIKKKDLDIKLDLDEKKNNNKNNSGENVENFTKDIEYITTNKNGEILKIIAKYGKTNLKNTDILNLVDVSGSIVSDKRSNIYISSVYAEYDYSNQNSKFYDEVVINYGNKIIKCDNLDLNMVDNIAVAYNNVTVEEENSFMRAKKITMNILTKDINIDSGKQIEITTN